MVSRRLPIAGRINALAESEACRVAALADLVIRRLPSAPRRVLLFQLSRSAAVHYMPVEGNVVWCCAGTEPEDAAASNRVAGVCPAK